MSAAAPSGIPFATALRVWIEIGLNSFGGPAGQIAVMHRVLVEERGWISERRFLHALNYCMLLPGPEAQQLATYIGWLLHGTRGGLAAGLLFVVPGFVAILAASLLYVWARDLSLVAGLLFGLKAAVLGLVAEAVVRVGRRVLRGPVQLALAALAFVALFFFALPFPLVVAGAAAAGLAGARLAPGLFAAGGHEAKSDDGVIDALLDRADAAKTPPAAGHALRVLATWLAIWLLPVAFLWVWRGRSDVFVEEAVFFSKTAVVTFGGAYAVLAYIAQQAVEVHRWLTPAEMLDGLGLAETTPGPLIMVVNFVAFLGAHRAATGLDPIVAGVLGSVLTTWVTFAPCFLWIFVGAPWVERLRTDDRLASALGAITASVVGVILNLALWLALQVLFREVATVEGPLGLRLLLPDPSTLDVPAAFLAVGSFVALVFYRTRVIPTLLVGAALGVVHGLWARP